ncbi:hypothetical protein Sinac_6855 [Singulisphaera acidiphila DSM 18658]|uniref:Uncharacterized protein n=1 Tax=Singulisphaera acidiphila (strain ATCC BAA-1392 / DSM 18658 / VKM B-2454 / MOB10) TaxID=886293 RepID=L0DQ26_SINAD|nr:hypothetical protein Sinac_6855 [Singulisphaera acidiphila DSM 18658]
MPVASSASTRLAMAAALMSAECPCRVPSRDLGSFDMTGGFASFRSLETEFEFELSTSTCVLGL